jgi:hypothetical protein
LVIGAAGVPEIRPVVAASANPAGSEPSPTDQVYGAVPPEAANLALYAVPAVPCGSDAVAIMSGDGAMVRVRVEVVECGGLLESASVKVSARLDLASEGVPLIAPVEAFNERPPGSAPLLTDQKRGLCPPLARSVVE